VFEHFQLATVQRRKDLGNCPIGLCLQLKNAIATFFGCHQDGVRRNEPDTGEIRVELYECFRLVQGMIKSITN
jgi:hypothetical protein